MPSSRLSSKGQLVIPKPIRDYLEVGPGDRLDFDINDKGDVIVRPVSLPVTQLRGLLAEDDRKTVTIADMNRAIRQRGSERGIK